MIRVLIICLVLLTFPAIAAPGITRITVDPVEGAAQPFDKTIARKLADELERIGYEVAAAAPMRLTGRAVAISSADGAKFRIAWSLKDASGRLLGQFTTAETAPYKAANPWDALDADTLKRLAQAAAASVDKTLEDTEAGSAAILNTGQPKPVQPPPEAKSAVNPVTKVFIAGVTGAPGDGDTALPNALAIFFGQFDIELLGAKAPDAYVIEGRVTVKPKNTAQQTVQILWLLQSPKGKELARIAQENTVPAGSLAQRWGKTAAEAAEGAADGLLSTMASLGVTPPVK
jgi:hypothetical protein